jgi:hypothetical protein
MVSHLCKEHFTNLALDLQPKPNMTSIMSWKDVLRLKHIFTNVGIPNLGIKNFKMSFEILEQGLWDWTLFNGSSLDCYKVIEYYVSKIGLHSQFGNLKQNLWPIEWLGIKLAIQH